MSTIILDACGMLNLYASGQFLSILNSFEGDWYLPIAAEREARTYRQPDPSDPENLLAVPIDLAPAIDGGVLKRCDCEGEVEVAHYVRLAAQIDDGESMGIAIAKCRGWTVLTDDKKARRIARELGVSVLSTTEVMKQWAEASRPSAADLAQVLQAIELFANYRPRRGAVEYEWWVASLRTSEAGQT